MTVVFNGKVLAREKEKQLALSFSRLPSQYQKLRLVDILIGNDRASNLYVSLKERASARVGIRFEAFHLGLDSSEKELVNLVKDLNRDDGVGGIMIQLPFPAKLRSGQQKIIDMINPSKDVDCLKSCHLGEIITTDQPRVLPATVEAIWQVLLRAVGDERELIGRRAVIIGRSNIVGKPLANLLINKGLTVTVCHRQTKEIAEQTRQAQILVSASGQANLIGGNMVANGVVAIDVGSPKGDFIFDQVKTKASFITPVPGGIGPMTIACLLENFLKLITSAVGYDLKSKLS